MTEQQMEALEQIFPNGIVIAAIEPNGSLLIAKKNPQGFDVLDAVHVAVKTAAAEQARREEENPPTNE